MGTLASDESNRTKINELDYESSSDDSSNSEIDFLSIFTDDNNKSITSNVLSEQDANSDDDSSGTDYAVPQPVMTFTKQKNDANKSFRSSSCPLKANELKRQIALLEMKRDAINEDINILKSQLDSVLLTE